MKKGRPKSIYHKLKTEEVEVTVLDSLGNKVPGQTKIINKNRVIFIPDTTVKHAKVQVVGEKDDIDPLWKQVMERTILALMGTKNIRLTYSVNDATSLPGYRYNSDLFGMHKMQDGTYAPGYAFALGWQEDLESLIERAKDGDWLMKDTLLIQNVGNTHNETYSIKAQIQPFKGVRLDLSGDRRMSNSKNTQLYYLQPEDIFEARNNTDRGSFSISFNMIRTSFVSLKTTADNSVEDPLFITFLNKRLEVAKALAYDRYNDDPQHYTLSYTTDPNSENLGYPDGYGKFQQDVMVATFLAVYSGANPTKYAKNKSFFLKVPYPNWRVSITGLTNIGLIKHYFRTFTISHSYASSYSINSYTTNLNYNPVTDDGFSYIKDMADNFYPQYDFLGVVLDERFSPLIGIDATMVNSLMLRLEVKKSRTITLNISNAQINEMIGTDYTIGSGYRIKNLKINVKAGGFSKTFNSDLNIRLDFNMRKQLSVINTIADRRSQITTGNANYSIDLTADYALGPRFNVSLFYRHNINKVIVGSSFTTQQIKFGIRVRFSLAQ
jgi:cell surface protein SprA